MRGWSLRATAKKAGLSYGMISEVERATAQTTTSRLLALVDALDADLVIVDRRGGR
jgi:transcriptional regulator with XRE-family HTH domain